MDGEVEIKHRSTYQDVRKAAEVSTYQVFLLAACCCRPADGLYAKGYASLDADVCSFSIAPPPLPKLSRLRDFVKISLSVFMYMSMPQVFVRAYSCAHSCILNINVLFMHFYVHNHAYSCEFNPLASSFAAAF